MTIQQLEYIIAVDNYRHFAKAAEACYVTQPTLSMMLQKLEDELGAKIFDRKANPVEPTSVGKLILEQARISVSHFNKVKEVVNNERNILTGDFKLGIIPTVAAYIVPELLRTVGSTETGINLIMHETPTFEIIESVINGKLDGGLAATPLNNPMLTEIPVYYEKFYAYTSPLDSYAENEEIDLLNVDMCDLWLLENIHCFRGQALNLCKKRGKGDCLQNAKYESGSLDTLISIVDYNGGLTIIPEMTAMGLSEEKQGNLRNIKGNTSVREVSLVVSKDFVRHNIANAIVDMIKKSVPKSMQDPELKKFTVDVV